MTDWKETDCGVWIMLYMVVRAGVLGISYNGEGF